MPDVVTRADELVSSFDALADALGEPARDRELVRALAVCCGWGARDSGAPLLASGVRHGVPWGVSTAIGTRELRVFVEPQSDPPAIEGYWRAAHDVASFAEAHGACLDRLRAITAELAPSVEVPYRLWFAAAFAAGRPTRWHAYLCIPPNRSALEALRRLDIAPPALRPRDRITIVSLDLADSGRTKAYVLMPEAAYDDVSALHDRASETVPEDVRVFGRAMLGDDRPIGWLACLGYAPGSASPATCALHFSVARHAEQAIARVRIRELVAALALNGAGWERACAALGDHHFVSFQRRDGTPRVTTYFMPRVRR